MKEKTTKKKETNSKERKKEWTSERKEKTIKKGKIVMTVEIERITSVEVIKLQAKLLNKIQRNIKRKRRKSELLDEREKLIIVKTWMKQ